MSDIKQNRVFLALGSNIEPERNLPLAVRELGQHGHIISTSRVWETPPVDGSVQATFLNAAVLLESSLPANQLQQRIVEPIEQRLNRVRDANDKFGPRTIDIDVTLFNRDILQFGRRRIPDPDLLSRPFVAIPVAELDPDYVHPETGQSLAEIAATFDGRRSEMKSRDDVVL